jgi:hypothetical protein
VIVNDVPAVLADTDTNPEFAPWDCGVRKIRVFAPTDVLLTTAVPLDRVASPIRALLPSLIFRPLPASVIVTSPSSLVLYPLTCGFTYPSQGSHSPARFLIGVAADSIWGPC